MRNLLRTVFVAAVLAAPSLFASAQEFVVPGVRVMVGPPAPRMEVQPLAPGPGYVWIAGHWAWRGGGHVWLGGHWALPPGPGYVWAPARWINEGGAFRFFEGHWRLAVPPPQTEVYQPAPMAAPLYASTPPPEPLVEVRPAMPFAGAVWIPGYWRWFGSNYVWVGGRYSAPRMGYAWEPHRWVNEGGRWRLEPGRWRR